MTTADSFEALYGDPAFNVTFQAFAEGLDGNGILDAGDLEVTAGTNANALDVAATSRGLWYNGSLHTYAGGTNVLTLSSNASGSDRWDLIYFDTSTDTPGKREGTPAAKPDLPALQSGEFPLAAVYVADGQNDVTDSEIKNYRVHGSEAVETYLDDSAGDFSADDVENALTEVVREAGDPLNGSLDLSSFSGTPVLDLGTNPGAFGAIVDMVVDGTSTAGTAHSFLLAIDSTTLVRFYAESDGAGGLQNVQLRVPEELAIGSDLVTTGGTTIFDAGNSRIGQDLVDATSIDLSISPTWTGTHTYDSAEVMKEVATPTTPATGYEKLYFKSDGLLYKLDDAGTEATVGAVTIEDDQSSVVSAVTAISAGAGLSAADDGDGSVSVNVEHGEVFEGRETGSVSAGNQGVLIMDHLANGEAVEVYKATLVLSDATAIGSSTTLELVTFDNAGAYTSQATLITGDGATIFDDETGSPLGSYTNASGSGQTIGVLVDNGEASAINIVAAVEGVTGK